MATCGTLNVLVIKGLDVVSTPPGARTWLAPRSQTLVYKVENTSNIIPELTIDNYNIKQT